MARGARWWLVGVLGLAAFGGCDPGSIAYFLLPEEKAQPELKRLASDDKKKEVKVVILTYNRLDLQPELIQVDRQLADVLTRQLDLLCKENDENVKIVPSRLVEEYKNTHPSRHGPDPAEVGRHFHADYVIYLELNEMSLYEKGSGKQMYRGRAHISVSLVEVNNPDDAHEPREFTCVYPSEARAMDVSPEIPVALFRQQFLACIARKLSYYFAPHSMHDGKVYLD
jgi:hypothetical protein